MREGNVISVQPKDIAKKRDFYQLKNLSNEDINFVEMFAINVSPTHLQMKHRDLLIEFANIASLSEDANSRLPEDHEFRRELNILVNTREEILHNKIENAGQKYLTALKKGDPSFFPNDKGLPKFLHFLSAQHFRTKGLMEKVLIRSYSLGTHTKLENTWNIMRHIFASNVSWSLYAERNIHQLIILENNTGIPFLTSDQPSINIYATSDDHAPEKLAFYYPVSPQRAMLLLDEPPQGNAYSSKELSSAEVNYYND